MERQGGGGGGGCLIASDGFSRFVLERQGSKGVRLLGRGVAVSPSDSNCKAMWSR